MPQATKPTSSLIDLRDETPNRERKFGSDTLYASAWVRVSSKWEPALFTADQIRVAMQRAASNPEDCRPRPGYVQRLWWAIINRGR